MVSFPDTNVFGMSSSFPVPDSWRQLSASSLQHWVDRLSSMWQTRWVVS